MISYELARQLKEAGFPQRGLWGIVYLTEKVSYSKEEARMSTYRNSTMHVYEDDGLSEPDRCEVRIDSGSIVISYQDDDGTPIIYEGKEVEPGHFKLESQKVNV